MLDLQASDVELLVALVRGVRDAMGYTGGSGAAVVHGLLDQKAVTGLAKKALHSLNYSTDLYLGDLALSGKSDETRRKYRYVLDEFSDMFEHLTPAEVGDRRVTGWERKALAESRRGGSDIVLRETRDEYACPSCVTRLQAGLPVAQESLL